MGAADRYRPMNANNPYRSPEASANGAPGAPRRVVLRFALTALLLMVGVGFLWLLNGQVFTNALIFLGFCTASLVVWIPLAVSSPDRGRRPLALLVIGVHVGLMLGIASSLPGRYEWQKEFNAKSESFR